MVQQPERFFARILISYNEGREICYIYHRQDFDAVLGIPKQTYDNSQFIEIGQELILEGYRCKVVNINFKLEETLYNMGGGNEVNMLSPSDPTDFNCQIGVFVERIEE